MNNKLMCNVMFKFIPFQETEEEKPDLHFKKRKSRNLDEFNDNMTDRMPKNKKRKQKYSYPT